MKLQSSVHIVLCCVFAGCMLSRELSAASWTLLGSPDGLGSPCSLSVAGDKSPPRAVTPDSLAAHLILAGGDALHMHAPSPPLSHNAQQLAAPAPKPTASTARRPLLGRLLPRARSLPQISSGLVLVDAADGLASDEHGVGKGLEVGQLVAALEEERDALAQRLLSTGVAGWHMKDWAGYVWQMEAAGSRLIGQLPTCPYLH